MVADRWQSVFAEQNRDQNIRKFTWEGLEATTRIELVYTVLQFYLSHTVQYRAVAYCPFQ